MAAVYGVDAARFRVAPARPRSVLFPRRVAVYLLHVIGGLQFTEIGRLYGLDRRTIALACAAVENARDDVACDKLLMRLESAAVVCCERCLMTAPER